MIYNKPYNFLFLLTKVFNKKNASIRFEIDIIYFILMSINSLSGKQKV